METNYFVCTLGQAALRENEPSYDTVNAFIHYQEKESANVPAVGFFLAKSKDSQELESRVLTFADLARGAHNAAAKLKEKLPCPIKKGDTVALLCPSTADFMFTWLALMQLGAAVLLVAPQLQPSAIAHLCKSCDVSLLVYDTVYEDLANRTPSEMKEAENELRLLEISSCIGHDVFGLCSAERDSSLEPVSVEADAIAYTFHTSGTSSGLPKPIPQPHRATVGVLPRLTDQKAKATFTTTPLYHGGISDCFRAWTSNALIWLFPGKGFPITANNIVRCLKVIPSGDDLPPTKYFTSVPYILQMMGEDEKGLQILRDMDLVGVGGAALSSEVGDRLVREGVNIVSRYGSAECGFLLSSHRDYDKDKEWQYLRTDSGMEHLRLESRDEELCEMVIVKGWPHMAKTNRDDGSFATADLLIKHPSIPNAWKYHSRADSQLTLVTGKKFDPSPLEDSLKSSSLIQDALIFGNDQPYPGVLVFPPASEKDTSKQELERQIFPIVDKLNTESQSHARIPKQMVIIMPFTEDPLEKSSKGTVMRAKAEKTYAEAIDKAYTQSEGQDAAQEVHDKDIETFVTDSLQQMTNKDTPLESNTDLYAYGLDSITAIQLRRRLQSLLPKNTKPLPMSIVEDCGTPEKIAQYVVNIRRGKSNEHHEDDSQLMQDLVAEYGTFKQAETSSATTNGTSSGEQKEVVVLTGATGALGAHILDQLRRHADVSTIYCLVRGADEHSSRERVDKSLQGKGLSALEEAEGKASVQIVPAKIGSDGLGIDTELYKQIASEATVIMHVAWEVNFRMKLRNFAKDNIAGLRNMIQLALDSGWSNPPSFIYCSSTASVIANRDHPIAEEVTSDPATASSLGYARSKWVAEGICNKAHQNTRLASRMAILRVGQLSGDTKQGIWNAKEAWPMMLSTVKLTGTLPALKEENLDWLPVDLAAEAFIDAMQNLKQPQSEEDESPAVYHIVNQHQEPSWMDMLGWLKQDEEFKAVAPKQWIEDLEQLQDQHSDHPAMKLLGLWKEAYANEGNNDTERSATNGEKVAEAQFATEKTAKIAPVIANIQPLDQAYFKKIWAWIKETF